MFAFGEDIPEYNNPYAPIFTDKNIYSWAEKISIKIIAPSWNSDRHEIDSIGTQSGHFIKISNGQFSLEPYKLTETEPNSGVFTGEITLTGFEHDVDGDGIIDTNPRTSGNGPTNGLLQVNRNDGITLSFEFADGVVLTHTASVSWNLGNINFSKDVYTPDESAIIRIIDPDMNLNPKNIDQLSIQVSSDSDLAGITVNASETTEESGIFEANISFSRNNVSSGSRLFAIPGDTIYSKYNDYTLPKPYSISENQQIMTTSILDSHIPPLERISISNLYTSDSLGNPIEDLEVGEQAHLTGKIQNHQDYQQELVYIIQIKDKDDVVDFLSWSQVVLQPKQNFDISQSWTPKKAGTYNIETFVWESLHDTKAISRPNFHSILISD